MLLGGQVLVNEIKCFLNKKKKSNKNHEGDCVASPRHFNIYLDLYKIEMTSNPTFSQGFLQGKGNSTGQ